MSCNRLSISMQNQPRLCCVPIGERAPASSRYLNKTACGSTTVDGRRCAAAVAGGGLGRGLYMGRLVQGQYDHWPTTKPHHSTRVGDCRVQRRTKPYRLLNKKPTNIQKKLKKLKNLFFIFDKLISNNLSKIN